jgi:hypothetical protein
MTPQYLALTAYGVIIPKSFGARKTALEWAETDGPRFGCVRIVQVTSKGYRTVWRHVAEREAA